MILSRRREAKFLQLTGPSTPLTRANSPLRHEITVIAGLYRPLLPPKFEKAMATEMAVMVVWGHNNADFCCVFFYLMFNDM